MITIKNLSKKYGKHEVLKNINFNFHDGKVYGLVGENGAGKTTLFRCIAGLEEYEGRITADLTPLKNNLGLLLPEPFFFPKITGEEYVHLLCNARNKKIDSILQKNIFDLPLKQYASTYSTGMKKKLALMAILMQENKYFILDEPYNGVDIQSNIILTELIEKLKQLNKIVIISSHIFSTLSSSCDEIILLKNGNFLKSVPSSNFAELEAEMKEVSIGNKIKEFDLK